MKGFHALFSSQNARESVKLPRILFTIFPDIVKSMELFHYHLKAEGITIASFFYLNFEKNVFKPYGDNAYSSKQSVRNWGFYVFWVGQNSYNNESALFNVPHCSTDWLYGVVNLQKGEQIFSTVALIPSKKLEIQHGKLQNVIWIDSAVHWWCCTSVVDNGHAQNCVCASCICIRSSGIIALSTSQWAKGEQEAVSKSSGTTQFSAVLCPSNADQWKEWCMFVAVGDEWNGVKRAVCVWTHDYSRAVCLQLARREVILKRR